MRRKLHSHSIARTQPIKIPDTCSGRMRDHRIFIPQLQPVGRARKLIDNRCLFAGHYLYVLKP